MRITKRLDRFLSRHADPRFSFLSRWAGLNSLSVLTLIFLVIAIVMFHWIVPYSYWVRIVPIWGHILVAAISIVSLFGLLLITLKHKPCGKLPVLCCCFLMVVCVGLNGLYNNPLIFLVEEMDATGVSTVIPIRYYSRMLRIGGYPYDGMEIFPSRIPSDAVIAKMCYCSQYHAGNGQIELLIRYLYNPPEAFEKELARIREITVPAHEAEHTYIPVVGDYFTNITITDQWDYYLSVCEPTGSEDMRWNHGRVYGAAVMERDHFILYFGHQW